MTDSSAQPFRRATPKQEPQPAFLSQSTSPREHALHYSQPPAAPIFLDFEASSLDLICSYPIEVGVCLNDGSIHSWLIRPAPLWDDWSPSAEAIHGISRQQLLDEGIEVRKVATDLNECLQEARESDDLPTEAVYSDAWTFDSFWLHRLFKAAKMQPSFRLESVSMLLSANQLNAWQPCRRDVIAQFGLSVHRAANDARILHETWKTLNDRYPPQD